MMVTPPVQDQLFIWRLDRSGTWPFSTCPRARSARSKVPSAACLGTIGTAPYGKECISSLRAGTHGANMDFNEVVKG